MEIASYLIRTVNKLNQTKQTGKICSESLKCKELEQPFVVECCVDLALPLLSIALTFKVPGCNIILTVGTRVWMLSSWI